MRTSKILSVILSVFITASSWASAESTKIKEVSLFKNGLGYYVCEVTVPENQTTFEVNLPAVPTHGSLWVSYPEKVKLLSLIAKNAECEAKFQAGSISELLRLNVGKKVRIWFDKDQEIECTIKYFAGNRLMIIEKETADDICLDPEMVKKVEFLSGAAEKSYTVKTTCYKLEVNLASPAGGQKLVLSQLAKGVTWAPSYIIDITDSEKAVLSAKTEIINESCDLNDVNIQLITGYPHIQFADVVSPMALKENLAQFLQSLTKGESEPTALASNAMRQSIAYKAEVANDKFGIMPTYGVADAGITAEDLFFYPLKGVKLAKGETGYLPLFTETVLYKHIYKWDIPDFVNTYESYWQRGRQEFEEREEQVWHCVRLENTGKTPWTTAPAQTIASGLILGQGTLDYTPIKGKSTLRITKAVNVKAEQAELETDRKREAIRFYDRPFDLVTISGKLTVTNMQQKAITLEINKKLSGEVKTSEPQASIEKLAKGLKGLNSESKLSWTIELQPGERKEIVYTYEVYVGR